MEKKKYLMANHLIESQNYTFYKYEIIKIEIRDPSVASSSKKKVIEPIITISDISIKIIRNSTVFSVFLSALQMYWANFQNKFNHK